VSRSTQSSSKAADAAAHDAAEKIVFGARSIIRGTVDGVAAVFCAEGLPTG
jgi:hypothetical protein